MGWPGGQEIDRVQTAPRSCCLQLSCSPAWLPSRAGRAPPRASRPGPFGPSSPQSAPSPGASTATSPATRCCETLTLLLHAKLVRIDRRTQELEPWLAESWTVSPDGLTYTLRLRPDVTFSDGAPFTSADVLFAFHAVYDQKTPPSPLADGLRVGGKPLLVSAPDPGTVVVRFPAPFGPGPPGARQPADPPAPQARGGARRGRARVRLGPGHAARGHRRASARSSSRSTSPDSAWSSPATRATGERTRTACACRCSID